MTRYILRLALVTMLPLLALNAAAQEPMPLSLQQAMDYAVKNNASAKNARLDVEIQRAQVNQQVSVAYPQVNGKYDLNAYAVKPAQFFPGAFAAFFPGGNPADTSDFQGFPLSPRYTSAGSITASQILFDGGVMIALKARNTVIELARQNGQLTEENVRYNVQKAYNALVIAHRQFNIIKNSLSSARSIAHDIAVLRQSGFAEKIDEDRTNVQVNNLATDSLKIANLLMVSEQLLKFQMGMDIHQPVMLTDTMIENSISDVVAVSEQPVDYTRRTEFSLLNTQQRLNEFNLQRYKLTILPSLSLFATGGYNTASDKFERVFNGKYYPSLIVGAQLNVPIFGGGMRLNLIREAKLNIEKTQNNIDNIKLTIDFQAEQAKTTLKNDVLQLESQKRNLALANSVLDLAQKKYKAGVGSNLEVNQAQTDLLQAQNNYFSSLLDVVNAQADLKKALGLLK